MKGDNTVPENVETAEPEVSATEDTKVLNEAVMLKHKNPQKEIAVILKAEKLAETPKSEDPLLIKIPPP